MLLFTYGFVLFDLRAFAEVEPLDTAELDKYQDTNTKEDDEALLKEYRASQSDFDNFEREQMATLEAHSHHDDDDNNDEDDDDSTMIGRRSATSRKSPSPPPPPPPTTMVAPVRNPRRLTTQPITALIESIVTKSRKNKP